MKEYIIPKGKKYPPSLRRLLTRLLPLPWFYLKSRKLVIDIILPAESIWKHNNDPDLRDDLHKAFGVNLVGWLPSDTWSCMSVFRCPNESNWQIMSYANKGSRKDKAFGDSRWDIIPGDKYTVEIIFLARNKIALDHIVYKSNGNKPRKRTVFQYAKKITVATLIGPTFGGNKSAPQDIKLLLEWRFEKALLTDYS